MVHYFWNCWKTSGILKFSSRALENSCKKKIPCSLGKLLKFCGTFFYQFCKETQTCRSIWLMIGSFCIFYRLSFSCCYCNRNYLISFCFYLERIWIWVLEKINPIPWRTPGKLLEFCQYQLVTTMVVPLWNTSKY